MKLHPSSPMQENSYYAVPVEKENVVFMNKTLLKEELDM